MEKISIWFFSFISSPRLRLCFMTILGANSFGRTEWTIKQKSQDNQTCVGKVQSKVAFSGNYVPNIPTSLCFRFTLKYLTLFHNRCASFKPQKKVSDAKHATQTAKSHNLVNFLYDVSSSMSSPSSSKEISS